MESPERLVRKYFLTGMQQKEIILFLQNIHNITISPRTLKRMLRNQGLYRRKYFSNLEDVAAFIEEHVTKSG